MISLFPDNVTKKYVLKDNRQNNLTEIFSKEYIQAANLVNGPTCHFHNCNCGLKVQSHLRFLLQYQAGAFTLDTW